MHPDATSYLHAFLDIGEALLCSGAEIFRVEDTINRMGYACGAAQMNVFVITSSIVITMELPDSNARTQTRRIRSAGGNDFAKLEKLNDLSRRFCANPMTVDELRNEIDIINKKSHLLSASLPEVYLRHSALQYSTEAISPTESLPP